MFNVQFSGEENLTTEQLAAWVNETLGLSGPDQYSSGKPGSKIRVENDCPKPFYLAIYFGFKSITNMVTPLTKTS